MVVAIAVGRPGIDALLVISQVVLSIVLPFITFPLIWLTSSKDIMSVRQSPSIPPLRPLPDSRFTNTPGNIDDNKDSSVDAVNADANVRSNTNHDVEAFEGPVVDFSSGRIATGIGAVIWLVVVAANVYVIVSLGKGTGIP